MNDTFNLKLNFDFQGDELVCTTERDAKAISREIANIKDQKVREFLVSRGWTPPNDDGGCYHVTMAEFQKIMAELPSAEEFKYRNSGNHHTVWISSDREPSIKGPGIGRPILGIKFLTHLTERGFVWKPSKPIVISDQP